VGKKFLEGNSMTKLQKQKLFTKIGLYTLMFFLLAKSAVIVGIIVILIALWILAGKLN